MGLNPFNRKQNQTEMPNIPVSSDPVQAPAPLADPVSSMPSPPTVSAPVVPIEPQASDTTASQSSGLDMPAVLVAPPETVSNALDSSSTPAFPTTPPSDAMANVANQPPQPEQHEDNPVLGTTMPSQPQFDAPIQGVSVPNTDPTPASTNVPIQNTPTAPEIFPPTEMSTNDSVVTPASTPIVPLPNSPPEPTNQNFANSI